jgi:hypothetical protein
VTREKGRQEEFLINMKCSFYIVCHCIHTSHRHRERFDMFILALNGFHIKMPNDCTVSIGAVLSKSVCQDWVFLSLFQEVVYSYSTLDYVLNAVNVTILHI